MSARYRAWKLGSMDARFTTMYCANHSMCDCLRCEFSCTAFCCRFCWERLFTRKWILSTTPSSGWGNAASPSACMSVSRFKAVANPSPPERLGSNLGATVLRGMDDIVAAGRRGDACGVPMGEVLVEPGPLVMLGDSDALGCCCTLVAPPTDEGAVGGLVDPADGKALMAALYTADPAAEVAALICDVGGVSACSRLAPIAVAALSMSMSSSAAPVVSAPMRRFAPGPPALAAGTPCWVLADAESPPSAPPPVPPIDPAMEPIPMPRSPMPPDALPAPPIARLPAPVTIPSANAP
mmetsp:Transcript_48271/g.92295  ORF Transcript_48271/g.92295 Transcript_48271/m.92295 type:complete len:295 (+) Transcript_48271:1510-2394(+)